MLIPTKLAVLTTASALALAACGGASDKEQARDTVEGFGQAAALKDYQRICDELLARELTERIEKKLPCEAAFRRGYEEVEAPRLQVRDVEVLDGGRARVRILTSAKGQPASNDVVELVEEDGEWRITALARPE